MQENMVILKKFGEITLPKQVYTEIYESKKYITVTKIKRSYGFYYQVMVCKKTNGKISFRTSLARYILKGPRSKHIDHIDRNPMNNSIDNLRLCSPSENGANRKKSKNTIQKYKGVTLNHRGGKFRASIKKDGISYYAGPFSDDLSAAKEYDRLAKWLFGKFANVNFPD